MNPGAEEDDVCDCSQPDNDSITNIAQDQDSFENGSAENLQIEFGELLSIPDSKNSKEPDDENDTLHSNENFHSPYYQHASNETTSIIDPSPGINNTWPIPPSPISTHLNVNSNFSGSQHENSSNQVSPNSSVRPRRRSIENCVALFSGNDTGLGTFSSFPRGQFQDVQHSLDQNQNEHQNNQIYDFNGHQSANLHDSDSRYPGHNPSPFSKSIDSSLRYFPSQLSSSQFPNPSSFTSRSFAHRHQNNQAFISSSTVASSASHVLSTSSSSLNSNSLVSPSNGQGLSLSSSSFQAPFANLRITSHSEANLDQINERSWNRMLRRRNNRFVRGYDDHNDDDRKLDFGRDTKRSRNDISDSQDSMRVDDEVAEEITTENDFKLLDSTPSGNDIPVEINPIDNMKETESSSRNNLNQSLPAAPKAHNERDTGNLPQLSRSHSSATKSKRNPNSSTTLEVIRRFLFTSDGTLDPSRVFSKECYHAWLSSRKSTVQTPLLLFRRSILEHIGGINRRIPLQALEEAALLEFLRSKKYAETFLARTTDMQKHTSKGYHEKQALYSKMDNIMESSPGKKKIKKKNKSKQSMWLSPNASNHSVPNLLFGESNDSADLNHSNNRNRSWNRTRNPIQHNNRNRNNVSRGNGNGTRNYWSNEHIGANSGVGVGSSTSVLDDVNADPSAQSSLSNLAPTSSFFEPQRRYNSNPELYNHSSYQGGGALFSQLPNSAPINRHIVQEAYNRAGDIPVWILEICQDDEAREVTRNQWAFQHFGPYMHLFSMVDRRELVSQIYSNFVNPRSGSQTISIRQINSDNWIRFTWKYLHGKYFVLQIDSSQ